MFRFYYIHEWDDTYFKLCKGSMFEKKAFSSWIACLQAFCSTSGHAWNAVVCPVMRQGNPHMDYF